MNLSKADDPQFYEQLCIKHDKIKPAQEVETGHTRQLDPSMLEYLFEKPIDQWDYLSNQQMIKRLA